MVSGLHFCRDIDEKGFVFHQNNVGTCTTQSHFHGMSCVPSQRPKASPDVQLSSSYSTCFLCFSSTEALLKTDGRGTPSSRTFPGFSGKRKPAATYAHLFRKLHSPARRICRVRFDAHIFCPTLRAYFNVRVSLSAFCSRWV